MRRLMDLLLFVLVTFAALRVTRADDWRTFRHDQRRSGYTTEHLNVSQLGLVWSWKSPLPPSSAWPDSARWDAYAKLDGLRSMRDYDPVFHPVIVGNKLLIASNADDSVHCFALDNGKQLWTATASAPVRVAPFVHEDKVIFGSDDGSVYCVELGTGKSNWERTLVAAETFVNDGRICSFQPVRTGVLFDEESESLIVGCGLFPWKESHLFGLDSETGKVEWEQNLGQGWTIEGPMLLSKTQIVSPQGRAPPKLFSRTDGTPQGTLPGGGGSFAFITEEGNIFHGPGNKGGWLSASSSESQKKLAEFSDGISAVANTTHIFVATLEGLTCVERSTQQMVWKTSLDSIQEMIMAGDQLYVGLDGLVCCIDSASGQAIWEHPVDGRAIGLAVANGHLITSTDKGHIDVFGADGIGSTSESALESNFGYRIASIQQEALAKIGGDRLREAAEEGLLERWLFKGRQAKRESEATTLFSTLKNGREVQLPADAEFLRTGDEDYWALGKGQDCDVVANYRDVKYPLKELTVVATVRVDKAQPWGGLASMSQDNGSYEKGWLLGFTNNKLGFAVNGEQDKHDKLTWVSAKEPFEPNQWYHVVGTYDGKLTKLYINGKLANVSQLQSGKIDYPDEATFTLGSYKDKDEHFYTEGRLNEIAFFDVALTDEQVKARFEERKSALGQLLEPKAASPKPESMIAHLETVETGFNKGPEIQFVSPGKASVCFWEPPDRNSTLRIKTGKATAELVSTREDADGVRHEWAIFGIDHREQVRFSIAEDHENAQLFECDGNFDYARKIPAFEMEENGTELSRLVIETLEDLKSSGTTKLPERGIALVCSDSDQEDLCYTLALAYGLDVIWAVPNEDVAATREKVLNTGLYGRPVSVMTKEQAERIPDHTMNLLIATSDEGIRHSALERSMLQKLQPGAVLVAEQAISSQANVAQFEKLLTSKVSSSRGKTLDVLRRKQLEGSSSWTHMYGRPDNTAFAGEQLGGAESIDRMQVQWAGRPGPRYQSDRGNRKSSPLTSQGRLYLQGLHRLIGMDAHNGTILWSWELPELARFNIPRDCANWCCDEESLYVAIRGRCKVFDGQTGRVKTELTPWSPTSEEFDWGYLAKSKKALLGSSVRNGASHVKFWGKEFWYDAKSGELANKVCSDALFAMDPVSGAMQWTYSGGLIVNPTISQTESRIVFVESRSAELTKGETRRLGGDEFWNSLFVVCLDIDSGEKIWESAAKPIQGVAAFYGVCAGDKYLIQSSKEGDFALYALDMKTGKNLWRGKYPWEADHHGKHLSRPAVVNNKVYLRPFTLDLDSGEVLAKQFPGGHQCGTYTASQNALFLRAGNLSMWDGKSKAATSWNRLRPDCWISTIPAEGMLLSPEGGGGCSCGGWLETSIGFGVKR